MKSMLDEINQKLREIETRHKITILYACESGSRAWGFPSVDSDYDVRFVYAWAPDAYLSIEEPKDVIEIPVNEILDINGWDIKKALRLFRKSNATIYEWLQSPIVYKEEGIFSRKARSLMGEYFSFKDGMHHYLGVTCNAFKLLDGGDIKLKKYFYCLRSLLAAMWIIDKQQVPPMEFGVLRTLITDTAWQSEIDSLLQIKRSANESTTIKSVPLLHSFIADNISYCEARSKDLAKKETSIDHLNQLFQEVAHAF